MAQENFQIDINLNKNQLLNAVLQNLSVFPSSPLPGQTFYHTVDNTVYSWNGTTWLDLGQITTPGVTNLSLGTITGTVIPINNSSGTGVTLPSATTTLAGLLSATDKTKLDSLIAGTNGTVTSISLTMPTAFTVTGSPITSSGTFGVTANGSTSQYIRGDGTLATFPTLTSGTVTSVSATIGGALSVTGSPITSSGTLVFAWTGSNTQYVRGDGTLFQLINDATTTTSSTWSSTKIAAEIANINSAIVGGLINKGGYDAATNTPNLDVTPIAGIKNGWTYVITAPGNFFTEAVQVGDMIIAKQDSPTTLAHWTVINKNIPDIVQASTTAQGIIELATQAEVNAGTDTERAVTPATLATYISNNTGTYTSVFGDGSATSFNFTHGLNTNTPVVQIMETSTGETVRMQIRRTSATVVNVQCNIAPSAGFYTVIIKK